MKKKEQKNNSLDYYDVADKAFTFWLLITVTVFLIFIGFFVSEMLDKKELLDGRCFQTQSGLFVAKVAHTLDDEVVGNEIFVNDSYTSGSTYLREKLVSFKQAYTIEVSCSVYDVELVRVDASKLKSRVSSLEDKLDDLLTILHDKKLQLKKGYR